MKSFKKKLMRRALLSISLTAALLLIFLEKSSTAAMYGGTPVAPTTTVDVYDGNLNGWVRTGYFGTAGWPWPVDNSNPGALGAIEQFSGDATTGYWHHTAIGQDLLAPIGPGQLDLDYFELSYDGPEIKGQLVSDWSGFEYRNLQFAGLGSHAGVGFDIDEDGDLNTVEKHIRFQPIFGAQEDGFPGGPAIGEWNHYVVDDKDDLFLDAVNTSTVNTQAFQSLNDLFLPNNAVAGPGFKTNAGGGGTGVVLASDAELISVTITGGLQGFNLIEEYVDFIQFTIGSDTTRFDFGEIVEPDPVVPEPSTFVLAILGMLGMEMRRRHRRK